MRAVSRLPSASLQQLFIGDWSMDASSDDSSDSDGGKLIDREDRERVRLRRLRACLHLGSRVELAFRPGLDSDFKFSPGW